MKKNWRELLGVITLCLLVAWTTFFSPVDYSGFDSLGNLLTSQAILQHHTIKLDEYQGVLTGYINGWHLRHKQDHIYYHYPLGTPLLAIPFVGIANMFHLNMANREHDAFLQNILSMLSTIIVFILYYILFRYYLPSCYSAALSVAFIFGSSNISTLGTALWSVNFSSVFILLSLCMVVYEKYLQRFWIYPYTLGLFLFLAYLCRPTSILFIGLVSIYFGLRRCAILGKFLGVFCFCLLLFMAFSWNEYRQILPDYYLPQQLGETTTDMWTVVLGHLISPSRGIFIYSPHLLFPLLGSLIFIRQLYRRGLFWIAVLWIGFHFVLICRNSMWWGGGCFGGRMFTDALPAFLLLTVLIWQHGLKKWSIKSCWTVLGLFLACSSIGAYINSYQGLYNTYTIDWGDSHLFDWKCPQFLASHSCLAQRDIRVQEANLKMYTVGDTIYPDSRTAIFSSWYWVESSRRGKFRWSRGTTTSILFKIAPLEHISHDYMIEMQLGSYDQQRIHVFFNGKEIGQVTHDGTQLVDYIFPLSEDLVKNSSNEYNEISFELPDAVNPRSIIGKGWNRAFAINLWKLRLISMNS